MARGLSGGLSLPPGGVVLLAAGKASAAMASAFIAGAPRPVARGLIIGPGPAPTDLGPVQHLRAAHPVPDDSSVTAGRAALRLAAAVPRDGSLVVLLSGGASSLMAVPAPGIPLEDKRAVTERLLLSGADIFAVNAVRKHLSTIKGGRLAVACPGALVAWLLSDVVGDDPSVIASGPTVADPTTFTDALRVLDHHGGRAAYPAAVVTRLEQGERGECGETPKAGDPRLSRATTTVIGSGRLSVAGAARAARELGYTVVERPSPVVGEARLVARDHLDWVRDLLGAQAGPVCLLSAGETTVTVRGTGKGGRNQEFVLAMAPELEALGRDVTVCSIGTDGVDGPTDAAGARADGTTVARAAARGLDARTALERNDAWTFFDVLGDLIRTGPTGTNVGDVQVVLAGPARA